MAYTRIEIDAPSSAFPGDFVSARVEVYPKTEALNFHRLHVIVGYESAGGGWETDPVTLVNQYSPFQYQRFDCMFKMRYCNVRFYAYTYYELLSNQGVWHFDTSKDQIITMSEEPRPRPECNEGETTCVGRDLYICVDGEWQLTEQNSAECYTPPAPPPGEEEFPWWKWFAIGGLVLGAAMLLIPSPKGKE